MLRYWTFTPMPSRLFPIFVPCVSLTFLHSFLRTRKATLCWKSDLTGRPRMRISEFYCGQWKHNNPFLIGAGVKELLWTASSVTCAHKRKQDIHSLCHIYICLCAYAESHPMKKEKSIQKVAMSSQLMYPAPVTT